MAILDGNLIFEFDNPPNEAPPSPSGALNGFNTLLRSVDEILPDVESPAIQITAPTSNPTFATSLLSLLIGGTASDNFLVYQITCVNDRAEPCTIDPFTPAADVNWTGSVDLLSGTNVITVTATDSYGNTTDDVLTIEVTPDPNDPVVTITSPTPPSFTTSNPALPIAGTATDDVEVSTIVCVNNRGPACVIDAFTPGTNVNWTGTLGLLSGPNLITITATDSSANEGTDQILITLDIDNIPPVLSIDSPIFDPLFTESENIIIEGMATDTVILGWEEIDTVECVNDRGNPCVTVPFTKSPSVLWTINAELSGGWNVLTITATDAGGNTDVKVINVFYTMPTQIPYTRFGTTESERNIPIIQGRAIKAARAGGERVPTRMVIKNHNLPGGSDRMKSFFDLGGEAKEFRRGRIVGSAVEPWGVIFTNIDPVDWDIGDWAAGDYPGDQGFPFGAGQLVDVPFAISGSFRYVLMVVFAVDIGNITASVEIEGAFDMTDGNKPTRFAEMNLIP